METVEQAVLLTERNDETTRRTWRRRRRSSFSATTRFEKLFAGVAVEWPKGIRRSPLALRAGAGTEAIGVEGHARRRLRKAPRESLRKALKVKEYFGNGKRVATLEGFEPSIFTLKG